jgi:hypothetical protein
MERFVWNLNLSHIFSKLGAMAVFAIFNLQILLPKYETGSFTMYICTKYQKPKQNFRLDIESNRKRSRRLRLVVLNSVQISVR